MAQRFVDKVGKSAPLPARGDETKMRARSGVPQGVGSGSSRPPAGQGRGARLDPPVGRDRLPLP